MGAISNLDSHCYFLRCCCWNSHSSFYYKELTMNSEISEKDKADIIRLFYTEVIRGIENDLDDSVYDEIDPDLLEKYDFDKIVDLVNFDNVVEVIKLGVKQKYGIDFEF